MHNMEKHVCVCVCDFLQSLLKKFWHLILFSNYKSNLTSHHLELYGYPIYLNKKGNSLPLFGVRCCVVLIRAVLSGQGYVKKVY